MRPARSTWRPCASPGRFRSGRAGIDPRLYQIAVLASLLVYGMAWLGLDIHPGRAVAILATALLTQWAATELAELPALRPQERADLRPVAVLAAPHQ